MAAVSTEYTAKLSAGHRHVVLRVEYTKTGWRSLVTETEGKTVVDEAVEDSLEDAKAHAEEVAKSYLADQDLRIPPVKWI